MMWLMSVRRVIAQTEDDELLLLFIYNFYFFYDIDIMFIKIIYNS